MCLLVGGAYVVVGAATGAMRRRVGWQYSAMDQAANTQLVPTPSTAVMNVESVLPGSECLSCSIEGKREGSTFDCLLTLAADE